MCQDQAAPNSPELSLIKIFTINLPSQPFLGRHLEFHIFFHDSLFEGHTLFLQLGCFGLDIYVYQYMLGTLVISSSLISCSNGNLGTPLSCAAYHGHDHIVSCLLGRDVSCNGSYADLKVTLNYCLCAIYILYAKTPWL